MRTEPLRDSTGEGDDALRARAQGDGYLYLRAAAPRDLVTALRARVEAACEARRWLSGGRTDPAVRLGAYDDARWIGFLQENMVTPEYRALGLAPELLRVLGVVMGDEPVPHAGDLCRLVSPRAPELTTPPHQDRAYLKGTERAWTAWMPLGDCPVALGPLAMLPGSHTDGLLPHRESRDALDLRGVDVPDDAVWAASDLDAGDVLLFSCWTVHRALPNVTADRLRVSVDYRYRPRVELA